MSLNIPFAFLESLIDFFNRKIGVFYRRIYQHKIPSDQAIPCKKDTDFLRGSVSLIDQSILNLNLNHIENIMVLESLIFDLAKNGPNDFDNHGFFPEGFYGYKRSSRTLRGTAPDIDEDGA
jgi:hypothetical protein